LACKRKRPAESVGAGAASSADPPEEVAVGAVGGAVGTGAEELSLDGVALVALGSEAAALIIATVGGRVSSSSVSHDRQMELSESEHAASSSMK